jgi:hypothetical protein
VGRKNESEASSINQYKTDLVLAEEDMN